MCELSKLNQEVAKTLGVPDLCADFRDAGDGSIIAYADLNDGKLSTIKIHSDGKAYFLRNCEGDDGYKPCEDPNPITQHGWTRSAIFSADPDSVPPFTSAENVASALELLRGNGTSEDKKDINETDNSHSFTEIAKVLLSAATMFLTLPFWPDLTSRD